MPTEVLVMCTRCGRPQPARTGNCVACGEALPDAPVPGSASDAPLLHLEGSGGRSVTATGRKLTYRAGASAAPVTLELDTLQSVTLVRGLVLEALLPELVGLCLAMFGPYLKLAGAVLFLLGALGLGLLRRHTLLIETRSEGRLRWPLGWVRASSRKMRAFEAGWLSGRQALVSRGVPVHDAASQRGPGA